MTGMAVQLPRIRCSTSRICCSTSPDSVFTFRRIGRSRSSGLRNNERTAGERVNGRLKDEFGGRHVRVRGASKVMCHCMFGVLALIADQLVRLVT